MLNAFVLSGDKCLAAIYFPLPIENTCMPGQADGGQEEEQLLPEWAIIQQLLEVVWEPLVSDWGSINNPPEEIILRAPPSISTEHFYVLSCIFVINSIHRTYH